MTEEELVEKIKEYYLDQNHTQMETIAYLKITKYRLIQIIKKYGLNKSKELKRERCRKSAVRSEERQKEINEKRKQTCLEKYGVEYNWQSENVKEKIKDTLEEKYGTRNLREIEEINEKRKQTCLEKYGGKTPFHCQEIQDKATQTLIDKYGRRSSTTQLSDKAIEVFSSKENFKKFLLSMTDEERTLYEIEKRLEYSGTLFYKYYHKYNLEYIPYKHNNHSRYEEELCDLLKELNIIFEKGNRKILDGQEIDIYIPSLKIGIEFNGNYWHDDEHTPKNYHQEKSLKAKEKGIFIYHIWEDEWKNFNKKQIIISQLKNLFGKSIRIYARNTEIKEITAKDCHKFLDDNHIQGFRSASYYYGLYYNNELVSCMTFGYNYIGKTKRIELLRFCNKKDITIVGGASKLFKNFTRNHPDVKEIISYCNVAKGRGNLYLNLGMKLERITSPNYRWVSQNLNESLSRYSTQMKDEDDIMRNLGYLKNYDCGNFEFVWKLK